MVDSWLGLGLDSALDSKLESLVEFAPTSFSDNRIFVSTAFVEDCIFPPASAEESIFIPPASAEGARGWVESRAESLAVCCAGVTLSLSLSLSLVISEGERSS